MPVLARASVILAVVLAAGPASADDLREFVGRIQSVSADRVEVRNRSGDQRKFKHTQRTRVSGKRKRWSDLRAGDSAIVSWALEDDPVECRRIEVLSTEGSR